MMYLRNVSTLKLQVGKCTGCGRCIEVCPHEVFEACAGKVRITSSDLCMECGACMINCSFGAISVEKGVGCASAIITGAIRGTEPECGCSDNDPSGRSGCCC